MDLFSRRIAGWGYDLVLDDTLTLGALSRPIQERQPTSGLIHHADRSGQYGSRRYRAILRWAQMRQSMSNAGNCYDNAFVESCFGSIKTELVLVEYPSSTKALRELSHDIRYDNAERMHSSLGYVSPAQFETQHPLEN